MTKYQKMFQEMLDMHQKEFNAFKELHDNYALEPEKWQAEYNHEGEKILELVRRFENRLCLKTESGKYGKFSSNLSDKFWEQVKAYFPKINYIGLK